MDNDVLALLRLRYLIYTETNGTQLDGKMKGNFDVYKRADIGHRIFVSRRDDRWDHSKYPFH